MPAEPGQPVQNQLDAFDQRLGRLEALVEHLLRDDKIPVVDVYKYFFGRDFSAAAEIHPHAQWPVVFVPVPERSLSGAVESPAPPWVHLVARHHPWRKQLYVKGRNMTVRQLVGSIKANQLGPERAAKNFDLPVEAIREALDYADKNEELLRTEAEIERLFLVQMGYRGGPLSLYLDDCAFSHGSADRLRQAGHAVTVPVDVGLTGADDPLHFALAVRRGFVLLTKNPRDFFALHIQCRDQGQTNPGILAVYQDNDLARDMSDAVIVSAIASLETVYAQTGATLVNDYQSLNDWRVAVPSSSTPTAPPPGPPPATKPGTTQQKPKGNK